MLVLTRRLNEFIIINDDIRLTISDIKSNQVRLGIDAPKQVTVYREEVFERMKLEKKKDDKGYNR